MRLTKCLLCSKHFLKQNHLKMCFEASTYTRIGGKGNAHLLTKMHFTLRDRYNKNSSTSLSSIEKLFLNTFSSNILKHHKMVTLLYKNKSLVQIVWSFLKQKLKELLFVYLFVCLLFKKQKDGNSRIFNCWSYIKSDFPS